MLLNYFCCFLTYAYLNIPLIVEVVENFNLTPSILVSRSTLHKMLVGTVNTEDDQTVPLLNATNF